MSYRNLPEGYQYQLVENNLIKIQLHSAEEVEVSLIQAESAPSKFHSEQEQRSSLPPLYKNQFNSNYHFQIDNQNKADKGGETSGYGSDNYPTPEYKDNCLSVADNSQCVGSHHLQQSGYESSSSCRDDRPKWGDKGVGVGKFWQPKEENCEKFGNEPPSWVKRGLQVDGAIVVVSSSPSVSPEQRYEETDRPCTGSSFQPNRTYIRGQNVPIDSIELAERERRRQLALAHQEAIRQQLEERERKRQEERSKRIQEEREEEYRIEKEQEHEKQRKLEEQRAFEEKLERERKRKEAIKEALKIAEKEAKLEKIRLKMMKQSSSSHIDLNITQNVMEKQKVPNSYHMPIVTKEDIPVQLTTAEQLNNTRQISSCIKNDNITKEINNNLSGEVSPNNPVISPCLGNLVTNNDSQQISNDRTLTPVMQSPRNNNNITPRNDQFTYFFQPTLDSLQSIQYAVLIPTAITQYPIAIPFPPQPEMSVLDTARTENRILTPTRYRNNVRKCDSSTQTDNTFYSARPSSATGESKEIYLSEKVSNLELSYENKKRERRSRSESMDERPKWGVNRPPTRYIKQSEKDPLYQRRKLRQRRDNSNKSYDEKNSSDDSQTGTPIRHRKKDLSDIRYSRTRWRTDRSIFNDKLKMYQREIVPLENDKDQLYLKCCCACKCQRFKCLENVRVDILKIDENSRGDKEMDAKIGRENSLPEVDISERNNSAHKADILGKLTSLQSGLLQAQEKWGNSPRTPSLSPHIP